MRCQSVRRDFYPLPLRCRTNFERLLIFVHSYYCVRDLTGARFGRLKVVTQVESARRKCGSRPSRWFCECACGNTIITEGGSLRRGSTQSCGCLQKERSAEFIKKNLVTHGQSKTPAYRRWKDRKESPRGLKRWRDDENGFANYIADGDRSGKHFPKETEEVNAKHS